MDPVTLIVTALSAGAGGAMKDTESSEAKHAYAALKALVTKRLTGHPEGESLLARHEADPQTWNAPLAADLSAADVEGDPDVVAAAQALMRLVDDAGFRSGKYTVDVPRVKDQVKARRVQPGGQVIGIEIEEIGESARGFSGDHSGD
jgi:hypothetical protein